MIDYSHPARPSGRHAMPASGLRSAFPVLTLGMRDWARMEDGRIRLHPVGPVGRGAHRPAPVSLVKSYV